MDEPTKRSRLPTFQILILLAFLLAVRVADDITLTYIGPYINQAWLHCSLLIIYPQTMNKLPIVVGDQRKVGQYYTGITVRLISDSPISFGNI